MGAAGLTSSAVEMGAKGDLRLLLDLDAVPCREPGMSAYEMLLSESQERMLMVLAPGKEADAEAIFHKWGLDFAIIGRTTDDLRFVVKHKGEIKADLPIKELGDEAPRYDRPHVPTRRSRPSFKPQDIPAAECPIPMRCCSACRQRRILHRSAGSTSNTTISFSATQCRRRGEMRR